MPGNQEHREIWERINEQGRELAEHQGAFKLFREDVVRRQEEGARDRHGMNLKLDALTAGLHKLESKMLGVMLTVAGSALVIVIGIVIQLVLKR